MASMFSLGKLSLELAITLILTSLILIWTIARFAPWGLALAVGYIIYKQMSKEKPPPRDDSNIVDINQ